MTPEQITLVQTTYARVEPGAEEVAALFYGRLFEVAPEVRSLFPDDLAEQGRKLMQMLTVAVRGLSSLDQIVPAVQRLGERHADYGTRPQDYAPVGAALLWTLEQGLGDEFTPEVAAAWTAAYVLLSTTMIDAAEAMDAA